MFSLGRQFYCFTLYIDQKIDLIRFICLYLYKFITMLFKFRFKVYIKTHTCVSVLYIKRENEAFFSLSKNKLVYSCEYQFWLLDPVILFIFISAIFNWMVSKDFSISKSWLQPSIQIAATFHCLILWLQEILNRKLNLSYFHYCLL